MQFRHVGIVCHDIETSLLFYSKWLGCSIVREMSESGSFIAEILGYSEVSVRTIKLALPEGQGQIELLSFESPKGKNEISLISIGLTHFAIQVDHLDDLYKKMIAGGVFFQSFPQQSLDGLAKVCFCRDPNGVFIELVELLKQ